MHPQMLFAQHPKVPFCRATLCPLISQSVFVTSVTPRYRTQRFPLLNFMLLMVVCYCCYKDFKLCTFLKVSTVLRIQNKILGVAIQECLYMRLCGICKYSRCTHAVSLLFFGCISGSKPCDNGASCSALQPFFVCMKWCAQCLIRLHIRCSYSVSYIKQKRSCDSSVVSSYCSSSKVS